jgi:ABC-2 type transport system permease protein
VRVIWAFLRASWLSAASYRLRHLYSFVALLFGIIPLFFVAKAIQPVAAKAIAFEGGQYFAFVVVGMVSQYFLLDSVNAVPGAVGSSISSGTFDTLVSVPTPLPVIYIGMSLYGFLWTLVRSILTLGFATVLGANVAWDRGLIGLGVLVLMILSYIPFGLFSAAMIVAFRTDGPLRSIVIMGSTLLGGVFYPTHVIPAEWIQKLAAFVPLSYGLRALRVVILEGQPVGTVLTDLGYLVVFIVVLMPLGLLTLRAAFDYARRAGTLAQY